VQSRNRLGAIQSLGHSEAIGLEAINETPDLGCPFMPRAPGTRTVDNTVGRGTRGEGVRSMNVPVGVSSSPLLAGRHAGAVSAPTVEL
jgi:hypothetical protein